MATVAAMGTAQAGPVRAAGREPGAKGGQGAGGGHGRSPARPDSRRPGPHLKALMAQGAYGTSLLYADPMAGTLSGPGWSTISTGVWPDEHGVKNNSFTGKDYDTYPVFLHRIRQRRPELRTYMAVDWKPLDTQGTFAGVDEKSVYDGDRVGYPACDARIVTDAEHILRAGEIDVVFVYFGNTDIVGHNSGAAGQAYLDAIDVQDGYLGRLLAAIEARPEAGSERWTVIVTTDHGHIDRGGHGGSQIEERRTFIQGRASGVVVVFGTPAAARTGWVSITTRDGSANRRAFCLTWQRRSSWIR